MIPNLRGSKFRTASNELTQYAFACGYIQRASDVGDYTICRVTLDLWRENSCYHVRAHEFGLRGRLFWDSFGSLTAARKHWRAKRREMKLTAHP